MEKIWREYEIVDIDTGEIMKKCDNKVYYTVETEKKTIIEKYVENGYLKKRRRIITRRFVKSRYQEKLAL